MNSSGRRVRKTIATLAAGCLALGAGGCSSGGGKTAGIELISDDVLTVCTHLPYKPFEFQDETGDIVGFDVSMLDLLADDLGIEQTVVDIGWNQIITGNAFTANKCDLGMGAMTITPKRDEALLISDPYFEATQVMLVRTSDPYQDLSDLEGKKLGVQTDTTGQIYADKHAEEFGYTTVVFEDSVSEFNAVKAGSVDAAINDNGALRDYVESNPDTEITAEFHTGEQYGFAAKTDDPNAKKLVDRLNKVMAEAKKDGTYDDLYKKWFGALPSGSGDEAPSDD